MKTTEKPSWLDELEIAPGDHVIAIVDAGHDVDLLGPYYAAALDRDEPCVAVASPGIAAEIERSLSRAGLDELAGALEVHDPAELGARAGRFDVERFLDQAGARVQSLVDAGASLVRHAGIMRWLDEAEVPEDDRIYLEARVNQIIEGSPMTGFCVYDSRHVGGHLLLQLLRTHPKALWNGRVVTNPFYVSPESVIQELGR